MEYEFELAGLATKLCVPMPIEISERLAPFLCAPGEKTDCTIRVQEVPVLPQPLESGVWHGPEYYDRGENAMRIFHSTAPGKDAFAVTVLFDEKEVEILVLPGYLSWFTGSSGIFNRIGMETLLLRHQGLLLHASLIKYKDRALVFSGPSGVGKSTQADLWRTHLGAAILNGDRAALRRTGEGWTAYGCPYAGTSGIYCNDSAPLHAIVVLRQGRRNDLRPLSAAEAFRYLYPELAVHHWDAAFVTAATDLCADLVTRVPVYLLECLPDRDAALLVQKGLAL
jgi:hypothetical protein